ncbi:hypothetical protein JTE90_001090 [Oedothorax gibbosus]|uniref:Uncharacterized protein n=1 Tax=Oedothorax gibbosus TaxID=931172 RepID=A0AAV6UKR7_9ARAC|nr:hypothetical protein JTE90_001090 [Oedothorax gibbosus]
MSVLLKQLVGSIISSYLGPIKSNKVVLDCEDCTMVKCPLEFLKKIAIKDPFSSLLENTLDSHHEQFGCSTMSLLAMWQLWQEEFKLAMEEGCEVQDIIEFSQKTLADVVSALSEVIIDCDKTCLSKLKITKNTSIHLNQPYFQNKKNTKSALVKTYNAPKELSSLGSVSIGYSSRHFSPFSSKSEEKSVNDFEKLTGEKNGDNLISVTSEMRKEMHSLVEKLSHDERDFIDLICNLWIQQVQSRNSLEFTINGICICPATLPCSNCTVVDGVIIKSNLSLLYEQDLGSFENCRALIIKGSILFEYVHLGYVSKVSITLKETTESLKISQKDEWIEKCCKLLMELQINVLLVNGEVDSSILSFCSAHSILVLPSVPWKTLEILCISVHESPCTYLIDCDEDNIVTNLVVKKWDFVSSKMLVHGEYYHIDTVKVCKTVSRL